ncbi:hypothetical protein [Leadbettera azotonutricia]|uniref:Uncharacterized protein n=1 Tax=Leadbettera azotonutricia (strain ATCC BAA-888 / DSM 13862 / ZAS-9) TaxID=545695 RepID=F5YB73_LEAAZ|nr:hypothetical protein [Leadbettera azotonutricia]AEF80886.1 hypothetical protein TREAZ_2996 [Leadbettera azotonutricia ZAS-9]
MKRTSIIAVMMLLSLIFLQRQAGAEIRVLASMSVLSNGNDVLSDEGIREFVTASFERNTPARMNTPQDLDINRNSNSKAMPFVTQLFAKTANKGMVLRNNILIKLRI